MQRRARNLLVQFGQLAADRGFAGPHDLGELRERVLHAVAGVEHHQRRIDAREFGQARSSRGRFRRQEPLEEEAVGRQRGDRQRRQHRGRAGQRVDRVAGGADLAHQLEAGIRDQRRAGVRHQRDGAALPQRLQDFWTGRFGVVLVILLELRRNGVALGQTPRDAGVLAGDDIDPGEGLQRPQRDVAEIADGGRDQMQARRGLRRRKTMGVDGETARGGIRSLRCIYRGWLCAHNESNLGMIPGAGNRSLEKDRLGEGRGRTGM
ncbi:hypothetical protein ACVWWK_001666 [Bradyrhizobium sp. LB9.1b]